MVSSVTADDARFIEATHRSVRWLDRCVAAHTRPTQQNLFGTYLFIFVNAYHVEDCNTLKVLRTLTSVGRSEWYFIHWPYFYIFTQLLCREVWTHPLGDWGSSASRTWCWEIFPGKIFCIPYSVFRILRGPRTFLISTFIFIVLHHIISPRPFLPIAASAMP